MRDGKTFLDLIAEQVEHTRKTIGAKVGANILAGRCSLCQSLSSVSREAVLSCCAGKERILHQLDNSVQYLLDSSVVASGRAEPRLPLNACRCGSS